MISRRTILSWLGLAPFAIAATDLSAVAGSVATVVPLATKGRTRKWKTVLEKDGSSTLSKDGKRYLSSWLEEQDKNQWAALDKESDEYVRSCLEKARFYQYRDGSVTMETEHSFNTYSNEKEAVAARDFALDTLNTGYPSNKLGVLRDIIEGDIQAVEDRSNPWR
jgi:hypothetical protein